MINDEEKKQLNYLTFKRSYTIAASNYSSCKEDGYKNLEESYNDAKKIDNIFKQVLEWDKTITIFDRPQYRNGLN